MNDSESTEWMILSQFLRDYLNRFMVYRMDFAFNKGAFSFAGQTRNLNTIQYQGKSYNLGPLLRRMMIPSTISIGGDFVVGCDFEILAPGEKSLHEQASLSIFDAANHGYEAFFLADHIRGILLNVLDAHIRGNRKIENSLFVEVNELMKGPVTQALVNGTNPARSSRTKGAVGLHGQFHVDTADFNFVCTGMPLFYYCSHQDQFYYLEPYSGPPLGYFTPQSAFYKPYVPHSLRLAPGDYLFLATDGCFDVPWDEGRPPFGLPNRPVRHFKYPPNASMDVMRGFEPSIATKKNLPEMADPSLSSFCFLLQSQLARKTSPHAMVEATLDALEASPLFDHDDKSLIAIHALDEGR